MGESSSLEGRIEEILKNEFFYGSSVQIRINNKVKDRLSTRRFPDLIIDISGSSSKMMEVAIQPSRGFLEEYVPIWNKEILNRGKDISIMSIIQETVTVFEYWKSSGIPRSSVPEFIKAVLVLHKLIDCIYRNGHLPQGIWYSKHPENKEWKEYITIDPIVAGLLDGLIDEVTKIPAAVSGVHDILVDDETEQSLLKIFQGLKASVGLIDTYITDYGMDEEVSKHKAGKATISVSAMFS